MTSPYVIPEVAKIIGILEDRLPVGTPGIGFEHSDGRSYIEVNHRGENAWTASRRAGHRYDIRHPAGHGKTLGSLQKFDSIQDIAVYLADRVDLNATNERSFDPMTKLRRL